MPAPIALQLYTVREQLARDFNGTLRRVAEMGFIAVETAGFPPGMSPSAARRLLDDLGLEVCSAHLPLPIGEKKNEVLETAAALRCPRLVLSGTPADLRTRDQVERACEPFNQAGAVAEANGLQFAIHNHWWEFNPVDDGQTVFDVMRAHLSPTVLFEVDVYWAKTGGLDPASLVKDLGARAPLLHIKDGPAVVNQPMVAVGSGRLDIPAIIRAGEGRTEWLIVELDTCATDMLTAVAASYRYLIEHGLARGHQN